MSFVQRINPGSTWLPSATNLNSLADAANRANRIGGLQSLNFTDAGTVSVYNSTSETLEAGTAVQLVDYGKFFDPPFSVRLASNPAAPTFVVVSDIGGSMVGTAIASGIARVRISDGKKRFARIVSDNAGVFQGDTTTGFPVLWCSADGTAAYILLGEGNPDRHQPGQFDTYFYLKDNQWRLTCYDSSKAYGDSGFDNAGIVYINGQYYPIDKWDIQIEKKKTTYLYMRFLPYTANENKSALTSNEKKTTTNNIKNKQEEVTANTKKSVACLVTSSQEIIPTSTSTVVYVLIAYVHKKGYLVRCRNCEPIVATWWGSAWDLWQTTISTGLSVIDSQK